MRIIDIANLPTIIEEIPPSSEGVHESIFRSYHILEKAKWMLQEGTPPQVVLDLIEEMEVAGIEPKYTLEEET